MAPSKRPETVTGLAPRDITAVDRIGGAAAILFFVVTWISSLLSPLLLANALRNGYYARTAIIIGLTIVAYLPWERGPISNLVHGLINYYLPRYFKTFSLEFEGKSIPSASDNQQTFYAVHPHGAFSFGWAVLFGSPHLRHLRFCFATGLYMSPFFRLLSRAVGKPGSASKADMISYMKAGEDVALPPGGFEEATLTSPHHDRVYIKKRAGFVKLCLQHGIAIRPVYVFGENRLYWNIQGAWNFRIGVLNKNALPAIVTWGHPLIPLLPRSDVDMRVVVGAPLSLPKIDNPSREDVEQWHGKYVAALTQLFEDHKEAAYGPYVAKTAKLELW